MKVVKWVSASLLVAGATKTTQTEANDSLASKPTVRTTAELANSAAKTTLTMIKAKKALPVKLAA